MIDKYLKKLEYNIVCTQIANNCNTFVGKSTALSLTPSEDEKKVCKSLDETSEACSLINSFGDFPIYAINEQTLNIKKIKSSLSLSAKSLLEIANILKMSKELKKYYKNSELELTNLNPYFDELYSNPQIEKSIFNSIISECEIADDASPNLSSIRRAKKNLELSIRNKLNSLIHSSSFSKYLMDTVITMRNDRFVVPVKEEYRSSVKGFVHDSSSSGSTLYIEPIAIFDMNNKVNDLSSQENKEIESILANLSGLLFPISDEIEHSIYLIGKLDFISAKAKFSVENNCVRPIVSNYIDLIDARHPLINPNLVVPITLNIGKNGFNTLVVTGPNTGGKTVTLKTVGLLCAMAQSGLHIPASEGTTVKVFDNIFADIGDEQSIAESLSTFSAHITNIVHILNTFSENSLVLVDELGAGTDPIEGSSLAISLLETFYEKGSLTVATTHYSEIKNYCLTHKGFENASVEFNIKTLKPTYHLLLGIPGKSNAFAISEQIGVPKKIIDRASSLISRQDTDIETLMKQIYDSKIKIDKEELEINKNLQQIELLRKSLEKDVSDKLLHEKEKIEKSKKEARKILLDAKEEATSIIKKLNKMENSDIAEANKLRSKLNDSAKNLQNGGLDLSVLLQLNNKETLSVPSSSKTKSKSVHIKNNKTKNISTEINLLGETVDSAISSLEQYLDSCRLAHLHQVRVVHGKGTGKLREGIHKYLKTSKYVDSFRIGEYGEGDYGVTIVYLK